MYFKQKFILASSSESRKKILKNNNLKFIQKTPLCNEENFKMKYLKQKIKPKKISLLLAKEKAMSVSKIYKNKLIVGSDTVIEFGGKVFNKAKNNNDAFKKIKQLSGRNHKIYSSAVVCYNNKVVWGSTQKSIITLRSLTDGEIKKYIKENKKNILKSAGCYRIEKEGPNIIKNIRGDFFNVMGFPLFPFLLFLKDFRATKQYG